MSIDLPVLSLTDRTMHAAFLPPTPVRPCAPSRPAHSLSPRSRPFPPLSCARRAPRMCEEPLVKEDTLATEDTLTAAERTRRALAETKPLVKFRRETEYLDQDTSFTYTKGVDQGIDVWLVTGLLTFLVPLVGFAVGVGTGFIDLTPR